MKFWLSWYSPSSIGPFNENLFPCWLSGWTNLVYAEDAGDGDYPIAWTEIVVAAVVADNEEAAKEKVYKAYDERPNNLIFRFVMEKEDTWSPFCDRFPRGEGMEWE